MLTDGRRMPAYTISSPTGELKTGIKENEYISKANHPEHELFATFLYTQKGVLLLVSSWRVQLQSVSDLILYRSLIS